MTSHMTYLCVIIEEKYPRSRRLYSTKTMKRQQADAMYQQIEQNNPYFPNISPLENIALRRGADICKYYFQIEIQEICLLCDSRGVKVSCSNFKYIPLCPAAKSSKARFMTKNLKSQLCLGLGCRRT